jgi:5-methyltetrahydropteroyltriglutamate--homocysteine methyltransferase
MKTSTERILTTHTGSLPRPAGLEDRHDRDEVRAAVQQTVARQLEAGVDIVNDGEVSKPSYATYVTERLSGFSGEPVPLQMRGFEEFPEFAQRMWGDPEMAAIMANPSCNGPVAYTGQSLAEADIANVRAAADGATEVFMSAASPGVIEMLHRASRTGGPAHHPLRRRGRPGECHRRQRLRLRHLRRLRPR